MGSCRVRRLGAVDGLVWNVLAARWQGNLEQLRDYMAQHPGTVPAQKDGALGRWVKTQRRQRAKGKMDKSRVDRLDAIGFIWEG
ncbi:hypothetical protein KIPB_000140 [Kipferlia bialata]|uniref:Helicase-associated domain-containing protein n=1 Tax=Kipferlia bialata TaxID=797122 RepID=A0A391NZI6_9EUKA|nr:hypothetical protein KIPB_000140 [Kipferlia bialata]|eukprot:g140.t1